LNITILFKL